MSEKAPCQASRLYQGAIKALSRLYEGAIQALRRAFKALFRAVKALGASRELAKAFLSLCVPRGAILSVFTKRTQ